MDRQRSTKLLERKDAALSSLESEVETLNNRIAILSKDLSDHLMLVDSGEDPMLLIKTLKDEKSSLNSRLEFTTQELVAASDKESELEREVKRIRLEYAQTKETLTVTQISLAKQNGAIECMGAVEQLQEIWNELGYNETAREAARKEIERCLEDTCARKLNDATTLKAQTEGTECGF